MKRRGRKTGDKKQTGLKTRCREQKRSGEEEADDDGVAAASDYDDHEVYNQKELQQALRISIPSQEVGPYTGIRGRSSSRSISFIGQQ